MSRTKCQEFDGHIGKDGYGWIKDENNIPRPAHRYLYEQRNSRLMPFMVVRHKCDNPA